MTEMQRILEELLSQSDDDHLARLVDYVEMYEVKPVEIAKLAQILAESGTILDMPFDNAVDLASTGGPSSLSTLIVPLYLRSIGKVVPKLSVPGRPAGGIDVLGSIPGFRVHLDADEVLRCLCECGYVHFMADDKYAPLDLRLFEYRRRLGKPDKAPLVIASLLSKKLVVNLKRVGLEIRVGPYGNFGVTWEEGKKNARLFNETAEILGIKSLCILTDARYPYQPWIGRGESLVALQNIFQGEAPELTEHLSQCWHISKVTAQIGEAFVPVKGSELRSIFGSNLQSQGSNLSAFDKRVDEIRKSPHYDLVARNTGQVVIDLRIIRSIITEAQLRYEYDASAFSDPVGVLLMQESGNQVLKGTLLAQVRGTRHTMTDLTRQFGDAIYVSETDTNQKIGSRIPNEVVQSER